MRLDRMNDALQGLRQKYAVVNEGVLKESAERVAGAVLEMAGGEVVLLPWRIERRFIEMKKLVAERTLEDVSTLRFASMSANRGLEQLLYRELDLCEYLMDGEIAMAFAVKAGDKVANVVAQMRDGKNVSIECSAALPPGARSMDRHEIIARRGVACDRVVDTQVPQDSIYLFNREGCSTHTDVDAELFGFEVDEVLAIRAALEVLKSPSLGAAWNAIDQVMTAKVKATLASDENKVPATFQES